MYRGVSALALCMLFAHAHASELRGMRECAEQSLFFFPQMINHVDNNGEVDRTVKCFVMCIGIINHYLARDGRFGYGFKDIDRVKYDPIAYPWIEDVRNCSHLGASLKTTERCEMGFFHFMCAVHAMQKAEEKRKATEHPKGKATETHLLKEYGNDAWKSAFTFGNR